MATIHQQICDQVLVAAHGFPYVLDVPKFNTWVERIVFDAQTIF
jgi:hypothetical protein